MCKRFIVETTKDPCCMSCNFKFDANFCISNLNRVFMDGTYKDHRMKLLLEREISKMPETIHLAEQEKKVEGVLAKNKLINSEIKDLNAKIALLKNDLYKNMVTIQDIRSNKVSKAKFIMPCPDEECRGYLSTSYKCELCKKFTYPRCVEIIGYNKNVPHECEEGKVATAELIKKTSKACPGCGERIMKIDGCDQMWCTTCHTAFSWKTGKVDTGGS